MKSRFKTPPIPGKFWLSLKPYEQFTPYDQAYIALATRMLRSFTAINGQHGFNLRGPDALRDLALMLASYAEDIVNETGIFRAFTDVNFENWGWHIPFASDMELDYESGELNYQDVQYLIWHFFNATEDRTHFPLSPEIEQFTEIAIDIIEEHLDELPTTEFYSAYLTLPDDINFYELKEKMQWLALDCYLAFFDAKVRLTLNFDQIMKKRPDSIYTYQLFYGLRTEYTFDKLSRYSALSTQDWMTRICISSETTKAQIRNLFYSVKGRFVYGGKKEGKHRLFAPEMEAPFEILESSTTKDWEDYQQGWYIYTSLVYWQGTYWVNGTVASDPTQNTKITSSLNLPFGWQPEDVKVRTLEFTHLLENAFIHAFGSYMYLPENQDDLNHRFEALSNYVDEHSPYKGENEPELPAIPEPVDLTQVLQDEFRFKKGAALYFVPGSGIILHPDIQVMIDLLKKSESLDATDRRKLFQLAVIKTKSELANYILDQYPNKPIYFPISVDDLDTRPYLGFLSRYFAPQTFIPMEPMMILKNGLRE